MGIPATLSTVPDSTPYIQYVATGGQTVFPYPFPITQDSDLVAVYNGVTLSTDSGYSLSGVGNATGGNVTFTAGATVGDIITLYRDIAIERISQIAQNSGFSSTVFNNEFNNIYLILQQLEDAIGFCLQVPNTNNPAPVTTLVPSLYANKYQAYDAYGNPTPAALTTSGTVTQALIVSLLSQSSVGGLLYPKTAAETSAGVTVVNGWYPVGYVDRYGTNTVPGTTAMDAAIVAALAVCAESPNTGMAARLLASTYAVANPIVIPPGVKLIGAGMSATQIQPSGLSGGAYVVTLGSSDTQLQENSGISEFTITIPNSYASAVNGVLFRAAAYCSWNNVSVINLSTQAVTGVTFRGGSGGTSCFGNTVLGGYLESVHIGCLFSNAGTFGTSQTILGLNMSGLNGDGSSIGYSFANANDGFQSSISGGFVEGFNNAVKFTTSKGVVFNGVYINGNTNDIAWSAGSDEYILILGTDLGGLTQTGTRAVTCVVVNGGVNGVFVNTGTKADTSALSLDGAGTALQAVTTNPIHSIAIGKGALAALTSGTQNVALGELALQAPTTTSSNTAVGYAALSSASNSGAQNTAIGVSAGSANTTGTENTSLGYGAQAGTTGSDNTAVGFGATIGTVAGSATGSDQVLLGDASVATLYCKQTTITTTSDSRDKTAIVPLTHGLDLINDLQVREWTWAHRTANRLDGKTQQGFVAQELQAVVAKHGAHSLRLVDEVNPDRLGATPGNVLMPLVVAVQELSAQVTALQAEIAALKAK